jgi:hypothetical protein
MRADLAARIERFDYGILARRLDPANDASGLLTLDLALSSRAPKGKRLMPYASGHFDVGVFPEAFAASVIDLWAVNLVMAVIPIVDSGEDSNLNCLVASLDVEDGIMRERSILMDTSRMRVSGQATVDFRKQRVRARLKPKAKRPQFFSLATPVRVNGSFEDFGVRLKPRALVGTVIRLAASPVEVPVRHLIRDILPEDGTPDCLAALERIDR